MSRFLLFSLLFCSAAVSAQRIDIQVITHDQNSPFHAAFEKQVAASSVFRSSRSPDRIVLKVLASPTWCERTSGAYVAFISQSAGPDLYLTDGFFQGVGDTSFAAQLVLKELAEAYPKVLASAAAVRNK